VKEVITDWHDPPTQLEILKTPGLFAILHRITVFTECRIGDYNTALYLVPGFEDVIGEPLGAGQFYNHSGSVLQLGFALSASEHPSVAQTVRDIRPQDTTPLDSVMGLREQQVLAGLRILDLGCGLRPGFAAAAKKLGAEVCTADRKDLDGFYRSYLDGHSVVDLASKDAVAKLQADLGEDFDIITENIVGSLPGEPWLSLPQAKDLINIAENLLASGGYLYARTTEGLQDKLLRKP